MAKYGPDLILPNAPTQYTNPLLMGDISSQSALAKRLTSGDFTGDLSWLSGLTNPNSGYLQNALSAAQNTLQPQFRDTIQQIQNIAAANGSLNSSTFTDALSRAGSDLNSQYQAMLSNAAMQDYTNANNNRLNLFGSGLSLGQNAIGNEFQQTNSTNAFNLENYGNLVAKAIQDNTNLQNYPDFASLLNGKGNVSGSAYLPSQPGFGSMFGNSLSSSSNPWLSQLPQLPSTSTDTFGKAVPNYNLNPGASNNMNLTSQEPVSYAPMSPLFGSVAKPYTKPGSAFLNSKLTFSQPKIDNSLFTKN